MWIESNSSSSFEYKCNIQYLYLMYVRCACIYTLTTRFTFVLKKNCLVSHSPRCQLFVWFLFQENSYVRTFYAFIVGNTNVHTNKWISFSFVYFYLCLISFFPILSTWSWPVISTSNMYECWFSSSTHAHMYFVWLYLWILVLCLFVMWTLQVLFWLQICVCLFVTITFLLN